MVIVNIIVITVKILIFVDVIGVIVSILLIIISIIIVISNVLLLSHHQQQLFFLLISNIFWYALFSCQYYCYYCYCYYYCFHYLHYFLQICSELNQSSLRRVREWGGPKGEWRWQVSEEPAGKMFQVRVSEYERD